VKLLDFGVAKQVPPVGSEATVTKGLTVAGSILGTAQYMSPEQLQGKPVDVGQAMVAREFNKTASPS
jgi:serine/threonine protein kinase